MGADIDYLKELLSRMQNEALIPVDKLNRLWEIERLARTLFLHDPAEPSQHDGSCFFCDNYPHADDCPWDQLRRALEVE